MLVVLTTDAVADAATLDRALRAATAKTFDRLDSDGCMSTNDTVLLLASGASGIEVDDEELTEAVTQVCATLADKLIDDCEGASKVIEIEVLGAVSEPEAVDVARAVSRSNLLKCAIHGEDPNWGRILSALGTTAATFDDDGVDVAINGVWICRASTIGDDRDAGRHVGAARRDHDRPARGRRQREAAHDRLDCRIRARELGVLHMKNIRT